MTHSIEIQFVPLLADSTPLSEAQLQAIALKVLDLQEVEDPSSLTIVITTDEQMQTLNQQYRGMNAPTDILSFPTDPLPDELREEGDLDYLGDILIGLAYTSQRAAQEGHSLSDELTLLVVHGVLHLLGFDHDTPETQTEMWGHQAQALQALDVHLVVPEYIHDSA